MSMLSMGKYSLDGSPPPSEMSPCQSISMRSMAETQGIRTGLHQMLNGTLDRRPLCFLSACTVTTQRSNCASYLSACALST